ncbi:MAG: glycoside hydrolase family 3 N-terminal domain-containing protein [Ginsengibacter sp.]
MDNCGDGGSDSYPINIDERLLGEIYLPPFKTCFERGGSCSLVTAYNPLNGSSCTASNWLLNEKLKKQINFKSFVIPDEPFNL